MAITGTTALVTGGARRIGRAIVEDLAANGFAVAVHSKDSISEAKELAEQINGLGGDVAVLTADLTVSEEAESLVERAESALGRPIQILVNNASLFEEDSLAGFGDDLWEAHFALHLKAPALLSRTLAARLPAGLSGLVVNMIDQRVWRPTPRYFSYTLSKSALWTATRTMAQSLAPRVRVNAIGPGPAMANKRQTKRDFESQVRTLPLKRGPELTEFGATVRWLWQARSVTGQMIALDGGQHLAWQTPDVTGVVE